MSSVLITAVTPSDRRLLDRLTAPLAKSFVVPVNVAFGEPLDGSFAFNLSRNQFSSMAIISKLLERYEDLEGKVLGVTSGDLFVPVLTYVFGEAQLEGKVAVVSYHRLGEDFYGLPADEELLQSRLLKESVHELGHTFGLLHCSNYLCVMHSSTGVEEIDIKTDKLCADCRKKLSER